jgi:hypothetical protein
MEGATNVSQSNYALRLHASLKLEAERLAKAEGTTLNQFINVALAEKISALRTAAYFRERAKRGDVARALKLLDEIGSDEKPRRGDERAGVAHETLVGGATREIKARKKARAVLARVPDRVPMRGDKIPK